MRVSALILTLDLRHRDGFAGPRCLRHSTSVHLHGVSAPSLRASCSSRSRALLLRVGTVRQAFTLLPATSLWSSASVAPAARLRGERRPAPERGLAPLAGGSAWSGCCRGATALAGLVVGSIGFGSFGNSAVETMRIVVPPSPRSAPGSSSSFGRSAQATPLRTCPPVMRYPHPAVRRGRRSGVTGAHAGPDRCASRDVDQRVVAQHLEPEQRQEGRSRDDQTAAPRGGARHVARVTAIASGCWAG